MESEANKTNTKSKNLLLKNDLQGIYLNEKKHINH